MMFGGMKIYTVHVRPGEPQAPTKPIFVREGFNWMAFFLTFLWAGYHRLWLPMLAILAFNGLCVALQEHHILSASSTAMLLFGLQLVVGFHGNDWLRARLARRGYIITDISSGDNLLRAQQRYFERYLAAAH